MDDGKSIPLRPSRGNQENLRSNRNDNVSLIVDESNGTSSSGGVYSPSNSGSTGTSTPTEPQRIPRSNIADRQKLTSPKNSPGISSVTKRSMISDTGTLPYTKIPQFSSSTSNSPNPSLTSSLTSSYDSSANNSSTRTSDTSVNSSALAAALLPLQTKDSDDNDNNNNPDNTANPNSNSSNSTSTNNEDQVTYVN